MKPTRTPRPSTALSPSTATPDVQGTARVVHRHLRLGWAALLLFLTLGLGLEAFHAFKLGGYVNPSNATRRLMWTLAHAHGTLLGLVNLGFAFSVSRMASHPSAWRIASGLLWSATVLLPVGFFLGGIGFHGGDPGPGIVMVPAGGLCLLASVVLCLRNAWSGGSIPLQDSIDRTRIKEKRGADCGSPP